MYNETSILRSIVGSYVTKILTTYREFLKIKLNTFGSNFV